MLGEKALIAISVGNTRTAVGRFVEGKLAASASLPNDDLAAVVSRVAEWWKKVSGGALVLASVNDTVADRLASAITDQLSVDVYRIDRDVPVPIGMQLDPETITGVDRLLNAAAAFEAVHQACIVVDAGTAITVDFVDGEGTFHGGAIAPGARVQLAALHGSTAALPDLDLAVPEDEPFGRSTAQAMLQGVFHGIRGMVQRLVERYAESYGAYPMVIATGGDAPLLFDGEEMVDRIVPDLTLLGIGAAAGQTLRTDEPGAEPPR